MQNERITSLALSIEELAMGLAMINRAEMGSSLLKSTYENLTKDQIDSRMTAASHSLLAHGYCGLTSELKPRLDSHLEQALLSLVIYDKIFQLSIVKNGSTFNANIHVKKGNNFTSHSIQAGVVHMLEYGKESDLESYLLDLLEDYGDEVKLIIPSDLKISISALATAAKRGEEKGKAIEALDVSLDSSKIREILAEDIENQVSRVTFIRIYTKSGINNEELITAPKKVLLLLKSKVRTWYFEFESPEDNATAFLELVSRTEFTKKLAEFLNS